MILSLDHCEAAAACKSESIKMETISKQWLRGAVVKAIHACTTGPALIRDETWPPRAGADLGRREVGKIGGVGCDLLTK
jgi:hypothetical protein